MSAPLVVVRCVCADAPFDRLLRLHREEGLSLDEIRARTGCCAGCSMCEPYVRLTLATGRVAHPVLDAESLRAAMRLEV